MSNTQAGCEILQFEFLMDDSITASGTSIERRLNIDDGRMGGLLAELEGCHDAGLNADGHPTLAT